MPSNPSNPSRRSVLGMLGAPSGLVLDVAALAAKYRKPLSARLFPIPGKTGGDAISFDNPFLTDCVVMPLA
ncbi:MAG TPA: DUF711 family protein [Rhodothermales bacterium]|nr:DUF711 family protein [Rhodothermales bacterium]